MLRCVCMKWPPEAKFTRGCIKKVDSVKKVDGVKEVTGVKT